MGRRQNRDDFSETKILKICLFSKYIEVALQAVSPILLNPVPWESSDKVTETVFHRFLRFALEPEIQQFQKFWSWTPVLNMNVKTRLILLVHAQF